MKDKKYYATLFMDVESKKSGQASNAKLPSVALTDSFRNSRFGAN
jgi:hypothetical protein